MDDTYFLEVEVPVGAVTGPVCVERGGVVDCAGDFRVLPAALIHSVDAGPGPHGATRLTVFGEGFQPDVQVWVDETRVDTLFESVHRLDALVPPELAHARADGEARQVRVFSPSGGRCGAWSEAAAWTGE